MINKHLRYIEKRQNLRGNDCRTPPTVFLLCVASTLRTSTEEDLPDRRRISAGPRNTLVLISGEDQSVLNDAADTASQECFLFHDQGKDFGFQCLSVHFLRHNPETAGDRVAKVLPCSEYRTRGNKIQSSHGTREVECTHQLHG